MKIALASPPFPVSLDAGLSWLEKAVQEAAAARAEIICFPESYLPGYPGMGYPDADRTQSRLQPALEQVCRIAAENRSTVVIPMDWHTAEGLMNVAFVVSATGKVLGYQSKNQLDPSEDLYWVPGNGRQVFEVNGTRFGIAICHEGFRYPESVRWLAREGAILVFHPHFTGSNTEGPVLTQWGAAANPYYEKASMLRAMENTIFVATSNYASRYPQSASAVIAPDGSCVAHEQYGREGVLIAAIDLSKATRLLAGRFRQELFYNQK